MTPNQPNKKPNKWLILTGIPFQMGITIYLFYRLGGWLDQKWSVPDQWVTKISTLIGIFLSLYQVIKQVNKLNRNE